MPTNPLAGLPPPKGPRRILAGFRLAAASRQMLEEMARAGETTRTAIVERAIADLHRRWMRALDT